MSQSPSTIAAPKRQISFLVALIVCIATPATLALSYYHLTGDPTFQPLALTVERLVAKGEPVNQPIVHTIVQTDGTQSGLRHAQRLGEDISRAFYGKGVESLIRLDPTTRAGPVTATFFVGSTRYGPYTASTAARGVRASVDALHMVEAARDADRAHRW